MGLPSLFPPARRLHPRGPFRYIWHPTVVAAARCDAFLRQGESSLAHPDSLAETFRQRFPHAQPRWLVRAPGRINLIGEHTDYNGYPVLPMALGRAIRVVVAPSDDAIVQLANAHAEHYANREFEIADGVPPFPAGDWGNYAKAAVVSLVRHWRDGNAAPRGMRCMVDGDVPPAAGLSSSSALVVASALAFAAANDKAPLFSTDQGRAELADLMAHAEHYVGTQGGGMDQAICMLARDACALRIGFFPLRASHVTFPRDCVVVAAHSTMHSAKAQARRTAYNRRVLECNIGRQLLARRLGVEGAARLGDLAPPDDDGRLRELTELLAAEVGGRDALALGEAASLFGLAPDEFSDRWLRMKDGSPLPVPDDGLKVLPRCRHVFSEAARVVAASDAMERGDCEAVGRLMNQSHASCAQDYEISTEELDELTGILRAGGAFGARLTGAGFGGFAIALAAREAVDEMRGRLASEFYEKRGLNAEEHVFAFTPAAGAEVQEL